MPVRKTVGIVVNGEIMTRDKPNEPRWRMLRRM